MKIILLLCLLIGVVFQLERPNVSIESSFQVELQSLDFGFPHQVVVLIDGINDRILLNSTLDMSPFDPLQLMAVTIETLNEIVYFNIDNTCRKTRQLKRFFPEYPIRLLTVLELYYEVAEYKGVVQRELNKGSPPLDLHQFDFSFKYTLNSIEHTATFTSFNYVSEGAPFYSVRISEQQVTVEYRVKELIPKSFTLKDFEFNGCDFFTAIEMIRIGSTVSVISSFIKALQEDFNKYQR